MAVELLENHEENQRDRHPDRYFGKGVVQNIAPNWPRCCLSVL
jgi:hypothetical protein